MFDKLVLSVICKHIDDPKTYFNFSLVCKNTSIVCRYVKEEKMMQFLVEKIAPPSLYGSRPTWTELPNGNKHGLYQDSCMEETKYQYFYNGTYVAAWVVSADTSVSVILYQTCRCKIVHLTLADIHNRIDLKNVQLRRRKIYTIKCLKCKCRTRLLEENWY